MLSVLLFIRLFSVVLYLLSSVCACNCCVFRSVHLCRVCRRFVSVLFSLNFIGVGFVSTLCLV